MPQFLHDDGKAKAIPRFSPKTAELKNDGKGVNNGDIFLLLLQHYQKPFSRGS